jgi:hypothetical protein
MEKNQVKQLFTAFLSHYDADTKDALWAKQSQQFREFWNTNILSRQQAELDNTDVDRVVRILDKHGKGNTKDSESIARVMIPQGAWRRMFNDIKTTKELSGTLNSIFLEQDLAKKAALINTLYEINADRRNSLTGQSGNAINSLLAAFDPATNLSIISLKDRRLIYDALGIVLRPGFDSDAIGENVVLSNKGIMDYFAGLGLRVSARTISVFLYAPEVKPLWKPEKPDDELEPFPVPVPAAPVEQEVADPSLFYMESQLEDFLIENWDKTELGQKYSLIQEDGELVSQQFRTTIGTIDILAREKGSGQYVVIELKKGQTSDDTVGQLTRYMGWLEEHKTAGQPTKGIIIAGQYDQRLNYALRKLKDVEVYLYQVDFKLREFRG